MNSFWTKTLAVVVAGILVIGICLWFTSNGGAEVTRGNVVYVCSETGQTVVAPLQATPAVNPATGKPTLLRGVYCPACERWYAMPPLDHTAGNPKPLVCRIHKVRMTTDGPVPTDEGISTP